MPEEMPQLQSGDFQEILATMEPLLWEYMPVSVCVCVYAYVCECVWVCVGVCVLGLQCKIILSYKS